MKKIVLLSLAVLFVGAVTTLSKPATAAPVFAFQLGADAGAKDTVSLSPKIRYCIQPTWPETCYKLFPKYDAGFQAIDCTKDPLVENDGQGPAVGRMHKMTCFDSASRQAIVVANLDGGACLTNLYIEERNPPVLQP